MKAQWAAQTNLSLARARAVATGQSLPHPAMGPFFASSAVSAAASSCQWALSPEELYMTHRTLDVVAVDMLSPVAAVRAACHVLLMRLSAVLGRTVRELVDPHKQNMHAVIFSKPLRAQNQDAQIGSLHALTLCMTMQPPLFGACPELVARLQEALTITKALGRTTAASHPTPAVRHRLDASHMAFEAADEDRESRSCSHRLAFRVACMNLMQATIAAVPVEFMSPPQQDLRDNYIRLFFESLTGRVERVTTTAKRALAQVITGNNRHGQGRDKALPKELLQACLRPVLLNLADYKAMSLQLLEGLARLLTLLSSCFNTTLGDKLFEHLRQWLDPDTIMKSRLASPGKAPEVAAAILNLFHLLPHSPKFLQQIVTVTYQLETVLHRFRSCAFLASPYRRPLTLFLNRYAKPAVQLLLREHRLLHLAYGPLFLNALRDPMGDPLRAAVVQATDQIIGSVFEATAPQVAPGSSQAAIKQAAAAQLKIRELKYQGVRLVRVVSKYRTAWLESSAIVPHLLALWRAEMTRQRSTRPGEAPPAARHFPELKALAKTLIE